LLKKENEMKRVVLEFDLPDDQDIPDIDDVKRLTSPDWVADWWHTDDIRGEHGWLTEEQAQECLGLIGKYHDPCIGINWDMISAIVGDNFNKPTYAFLVDDLSHEEYPYGIELSDDIDGNEIFDVEWYKTAEDRQRSIDASPEWIFPKEESHA
jgi:hypothetical protein